jgi:hypothetical protein
MTLLYSLHLSRHPKGFGKPSVYPRVKHEGIHGHTDPATGELVVPNFAEVREALPHYYRAAFDRTGAQYWFDANKPLVPCHLTLRNSRGKYLNTLYAIPYNFEVPNVAQA